MAVGIHKLIAAIAPDYYCSDAVKDMIVDPDTGKRIKNSEYVKKLVKEGVEKYNSTVKELKEKKVKKEDYYLYMTDIDNYYLKAAEKATPKGFDAFYGPIDFEKFMYRNAANPLTEKTSFLLKNPTEEHKVTYDNFNESLETSYFYLLNLMNNMGFSKQVKVIDNFISSPGSGHFSEMGGKASRMQEEAMKMLGAANQVIKSILNLIYDLKEFKIRLALYKKIKLEGEKEKAERDSAMFSLKQIWLDTVDAKRGNSSIKAMALTQAGFVTLIDAFMAVEDESLKYEGQEIDLNERVKRILKQRVLEFKLWLRESEKELNKRYELEKIYLRSQYSTIQLYARWLKPYLTAARKLEQNASEDATRANVVNMFNSTVLELVVLGKDSGPYNPLDDIYKGDLPKLLKKDEYSNKRKYTSLLVVEFVYTSYPERTSQGNYGFRGKVEVKFSGYALSAEEITTLEEEIKKDDFGDVLNWIEQSTGQSLGTLRDDVNQLLSDAKEEEEGEKKKEEKKASEDDLNPFTALFDFFKSDKEKKNKEDKSMRKVIKEDSYYDKIYRAQAILSARSRCAKIYELFKKNKQMPTFGVLEDAF